MLVKDPQPNNKHRTFSLFWKRGETKERKLLSVALGTYFKHHLLIFTGPAMQDSALKKNLKREKRLMAPDGEQHLAWCGLS